MPSFTTRHWNEVPQTEGQMPPPPKVYLRGSVTPKPVTAKRARNIAQQEAKRCMQRLAEKKHLTTSIGGANIAAAGVVNSAVVLSQGSSASTRTGNQIHLSLLTMMGNASIAAASAGDLYRLIVGWDTEADGAAPAVTDVLETAAFTATYNRDKVKPGGRFMILTDKIIQCNAMTAVTGAVVHPIRYTRKLDKVVYYQSNAGTISDVLKNNLFTIQITLNGTVNTTLNAQVCFTDL